MQQFLKTPPGMAGAGVVAAELFEQLFVAVDDADAALDARFGRVAFAAFAAYFKSSGPRCGCSWCPPLLIASGGGSHRGSVDRKRENGGETPALLTSHRSLPRVARRGWVRGDP